MRMGPLPTLLLLAGLAACGNQGSPTATDAVQMEAAPAAPRAASAAAAAVSVALPQIAYVYDYTLELPAKAVTPLFERHRRACEAAGPARCQVLGAETQTVGRTDTRATLSLRAEAAWLAAFRARLPGEADGADGRVAESRTTSEDLGRQLSDTGARLRALTTLQGRLEQLLARRDGKLADLLEIERELARVGGELDATRSALADMRGRVQLPKATIVYRPDSLTAAGAEARGSGLAGDLFEVARTSLFALLGLIAAVLPWALVIAPLVWLIQRWRARRRPSRLDAPPPGP